MNRLYFRSPDKKTVRVVINVSAEHFIVFKFAGGYSTMKTWVGDFAKTRDSWNMRQYRPRKRTRDDLEDMIIATVKEHAFYILDPWITNDLVPEMEARSGGKRYE